MKMKIFLLQVFLLLILSARAQVFTESNLPIVIINTDNGFTVPDEPGIFADMKLIFRGPGLINYVTDQDSVQFLNYNGRIDIEIRGSYSQVFPKKSYGFTTIMPDNITKNNVSLLGMPSENDWILDGLSSDPSLIRNFLSYNLSRKIGLYASRTAYCEVVLNGDYRGLYILEEKIKADKNRVNILKIGTGDNNTPELSGGYITKTDKLTGGDPIAWSMSSYIGFNDCNFIHQWPKPENVTTQQNNYIKSVFINLQSVCSAGNESITSGYPSIIDIPSFVDYILVNEIASNVDAYGFSTFYHKDRNGKLRAGPIWDMNLTFGNDLFEFGVDRSKPDVWQFSNGSIEGPKYYRDLFNNAQFKCYLSRRWNDLTQPDQPFALMSIDSYIDSTVAVISEAVVRDYTRWGIVGNHQDAINSLKAWLDLRLPWMTNHLGSYSACQNIATPPLVLSRINYHPDTTMNFPDEDKLEFLEITNAGTTDIDLTGIYFSGTGLVYQFPAGSSLPGEAAIYLASDSTTFQTKYGITAFGQFTRNLSNDNQKLVLSDAFGNEIDYVHYFDSLPWPDADGNGKHLKLISNTLDNALASSWEAAGDNTMSAWTLSEDHYFSLYPNPAKSYLSLNAQYLIEEVCISDIQGRILETFIINEKDFSCNISRLPAGMYFIRIVTSGNTCYEKIIKE